MLSEGAEENPIDHAFAAVFNEEFSEVTKSHPEGGYDIKFSIDWFHNRIVVIKMKLPNSVPSQVNFRIVETE